VDEAMTANAVSGKPDIEATADAILHTQPDHSGFAALAETYSLIRVRGKDPEKAEGKGWMEFCHQKRPFHEIKFRVGENAGIACGPASDVLAFDVDHLALFESFCQRHGWNLPTTRTHETGSGNYHLLFRYPKDGQKYGNKSLKTCGFDIRGDGGQIVAPGSIHPDTERPYKVLHDAAMVDLPPEILKQLYPKHPTAWTKITVTADGLIARKGLSDDIKLLIRDGAPKGERSEPMMACLNAMVRDRWSDDQIFWAFYTQKIGEKFMEVRSNRDAWLQPQIAKVRATTHAAGTAQAEPSTEDWEPEILEWPTLPELALYGVAGDLVKLATRKSEADPAAVLATFLARFAAETGNGPYLRVGDAKQYARINVAVVGDTSKSRKGTSHGPVERCFVGLTSFSSFSSSNKYICAHVTPGPLSSGEGLIYAVRDPVEKSSYDRKACQESVTVVDTGISDKRLFVCDEELGGALSCTKREGNTLSTVIRCAWDHGNLDPLTKTNKISATGAHIALVGHITRAELRRKLEDSEAFNGFANRFLWVCARRNGLHAFPEPMPTEELKEIQRTLSTVLTYIHENITEMTLTTEARHLWVNVYPEISADHDGLAGAVINRGEAQVLRLAMLYALMDKTPAIDVKHLEAALAMWDYCKRSAEHIFHGFEADPVSDKIMKKVTADSEVDWTELYSLFSNNVSKQSLDTAVNDLIRKGKVFLRTLHTGDRGRPKRMLRANSELPLDDEEQSTNVELNEINEVNVFLRPNTNSDISIPYEVNEINEVIQETETPPPRCENCTFFEAEVLIRNKGICTCDSATNHGQSFLRLPLDGEGCPYHAM
jgi:hypothetical protein